MTVPHPHPETADPAHRQTLAERLAQGPLSLAQSLAYAAQVAGQLRDLHGRGSAHGLVSSAAVELTASGAKLLPSNAYPGEYTAPRDVQSWGFLLQELLAGSGAMDAAAAHPSEARKGPEAVLPAARKLARKCTAHPSERLLSMQQVFNEIRLLAVLARQYHLDRVPAPTGTVTDPIPAPSPGAGPLDLTSFARGGAEAAIAEAAPAHCGPCPKCETTPVFLSRPRTLVENLLVAWGVSLCRCHRCLHRWLALGKLRLDKPVAHASYGAPVEPRG